MQSNRKASPEGATYPGTIMAGHEGREMIDAITELSNLTLELRRRARLDYVLRPYMLISMEVALP